MQNPFFPSLDFLFKALLPSLALPLVPGWQPVKFTLGEKVCLK